MKFVYPALYKDTVNTERNYLWSLQENGCQVEIPGCAHGDLAGQCATVMESLLWAAAERAWVIVSPRTQRDIVSFSQYADRLKVIVLDFTDNEEHGMFSNGRNTELLRSAQAVFRTSLWRDEIRLVTGGFAAEYLRKVQYIPLPPRLPRGNHPTVMPRPCKVFYMWRPTHAMRVRVIAQLYEAFGTDFVGGFSNLEILQEKHRYWQPIRDAIYPVLEKHPDLVQKRMSNKEFHAYLAGAEVALIVRGMAIQDYRTHAFLHYRQSIVRDNSILDIHDFVDPARMVLFDKAGAVDTVTRLLKRTDALPVPPAPLAVKEYSRIIVDTIGILES